MARVTGRRENLAGESSGGGNREGVPKTSGVAEKPRGGCQGVGGGVESPQGIDTPGVEDLPREDKTSGVPTKGEGVPGEDRQG